MLTGNTTLLLHLGDPTHSFKAPMIYNPWFDHAGIDARVVPLGMRSTEFGTGFEIVMKATNVRGALVTMPHKVTVLDLVDEVRPTAAIAGAANAVRVEADGRLVADMFDGEGFVRGMLGNGRMPQGASALVVGSGGVGSAIAASLAAAGVSRLAVYDTRVEAMEGLAERLRRHYPQLQVETGGNDPAGFEVVVNGTPLGMNPGDPMPVEISRLDPGSFVGEVVMTHRVTPFLGAARERGCATQVGTDMLFEQIPAYLEFFGFDPVPTPAQLREHATIAG
ncbi:shikimate dehydrogenase [Enemella dayhoffiae]|uniref:Shikimate dehydrogenase n=1 Tax=Enemella dayhoffiae TaxID=2016507 RepID=A0A255GL75_9ACTN|nr:shikimate dehydrogenase [Enemella dayhoffiae]OYO16587.1 shikimate dehydrogenase [Enemella dayhoffiae]